MKPLFTIALVAACYAPFCAEAGTITEVSYPGSICWSSSAYAQAVDGSMMSSQTTTVPVNCPIPNYYGSGSRPGYDVKKIIGLSVTLIDGHSTQNVGCNFYSHSSNKSSSVYQNLVTSGTGTKELVFKSPATHYSNGYMHLHCNLPPIEGLSKSGILQYRVKYEQI